MRGAIPPRQHPGYFPSFKRPLPFDPYLCERYFPRVPEGDDTTITQALLQRNASLMPTAAEEASINLMVSKVKQILDGIMTNPQMAAKVEIQEVREVGSFKKGTMVTKSNVADLVVILKTLPTVELVMNLGQKVVDDLKADLKEIFGCVSRAYGCEIAGTQAVVRLYVTISPPCVPLLEPDLHLPVAVLQENMAMIRHARWFEENGNISSLKVLVRCLKDMKKRHEGWENLSIWHIELLAHYSINHTSNRQPLPLSHAFKRFLQLLSTGILLPGSPSLSDPCDRGLPLTNFYSPADMDSICCAAQTLLRVLSHGGVKMLLGTDSRQVNVTAEVSMWDSVVVTPLEKAYGVGDEF
uniref:DZF domain-containing protein n=1 Tax=Panagrellus redivivus TaxID=6233 RepID=A0A7E4W264_PANRE